MKKTTFSEEQIAMALHRTEQTGVEDVLRKLGIAQATFYRWNAKYGGLLPAELKRLKQPLMRIESVRKLVGNSR